MKLPRILVYILMVVAPNVALGAVVSLSEIGHEPGDHWLSACLGIYDYKLSAEDNYDAAQVKKLKPIMYAACTYIKNYEGDEARTPFYVSDFICTIDGDRCKLANEVECWINGDIDNAARQYSWNDDDDDGNLIVYCSGGNDFLPTEYEGCVLIGPGQKSRKVAADDDEKDLCNGENYGKARTSGNESVDLKEADKAVALDGAAGTDLGTPGGDTTDSEKPDTSDSSEDSSDNDADSVSDEIIDAESESELSEQKIADLAKNASAMTKTEQSTANKLLGGASIAATGIGGMQLASAIAENRADDAAERDMAAYLATFRCDYGQGRNIMGGETDVQLPGGNNLIELKQQFMELAADLKTRKDALEMTPGIESEVILDSANMGLYDDESLGITDGAYTSLSRALSDPDGADAAEWAQQRSDTKSQLTTGAVMAGVGIVGGVVGNLLINRDAPDEKSDEINLKYEPLKKLRDDTLKLPDNTVGAQCPSDATGTYPDCECTDTKHVYNGTANKCEECTGEQIAISATKCGCPSGTAPGDNDTCIELSPDITPECDPNGSHIHINPETGECSCKDGYQLILNQCMCPAGFYTSADGKCKFGPAPTIEIPERAILPAKNLFELNSAELTQDAEKAIEDFAAEVINKQGNNTTYCITVDGYTDRSGRAAYNMTLSTQRANAVKNALKNAQIPETNIKATGYGERNCKYKNGTDVPDDTIYPNCRRVEIGFTEKACK